MARSDPIYMHDSGGEAERAGICTEGWIHTYSMVIIHNYNLQCMELTTQGTGKYRVGG